MVLGIRTIKKSLKENVWIHDTTYQNRLFGVNSEMEGDKKKTGKNRNKGMKMRFFFASVVCRLHAKRGMNESWLS